MLYGIIMAGGSGTRFWPKSRKTLAKHHLPIAGSRTMLQQTVDRLRHRLPFERILVVTIEEQVEITSQQIPELPKENIIAEPVGRNTAACVGLGALFVHHRDPDPTILVVTADHVIRPYETFWKNVDVGVELVKDNKTLVIFGIKPSWGNPGFGYIHRDETAEDLNGIRSFRVNKFEEKPSPEVATKFFDSGDYFWNSGMFVWKSSTILAELQTHVPEIYNYLAEIKAAIGTPSESVILKETYPKIPKQPIDKAVMEKARDVKVIEATFEWDDVGSWKALPNHYPQDDAGNTVIGEHQSLNTKGCIIASEPGHLIATVGVTDLIIVQTKDATLVCKKEDAERVKEIVGTIEKSGKKEWL